MVELLGKRSSSFAAVTLFCMVFAVSLGHGADKAPVKIRDANAAVAEHEPHDLVRQGKRIFDNTPKYARQYVGNKLSCNDCHIGSGTTAYAAPLIDLAGLFPMYNKRAGHVISLATRVQECFTRSEAGQPPPVDSVPIRALVAYINSLSRNGVKGQPYKSRGLVNLPALKGDPENGKVIYAVLCSACHGFNGEGAPPALPAVWGSSSFNDGAGMNDPTKMAKFIIHNMPQSSPGTLTPQEAFDVAAYIHSQPRPKFNPAYKSY